MKFKLFEINSGILGIMTVNLEEINISEIDVVGIFNDDKSEVFTHDQHMFICDKDKTTYDEQTMIEHIENEHKNGRKIIIDSMFTTSDFRIINDIGVKIDNDNGMEKVFLDAISKILKNEHFYEEQIVEHVNVLMKIYESKLTPKQIKICLCSDIGWLRTPSEANAILRGFLHGLTEKQIQMYIELCVSLYPFDMDIEFIINDIIEYGFTEEQIKLYMRYDDVDQQDVIRDAFKQGLSVEQVEPLIDKECWLNTKYQIKEKYSINN